MSDISLIDSNFKVQTNLKVADIKFYDVQKAPFSVYGVFHENGNFRRIPQKVAKSVSDGVYNLHTHTAGGRVRFKTDSSYVAINTSMTSTGKMPHFAFTGSVGFDMYADNKYAGTFVVPFDIKDGYESIIYFPNKQMREITINFPLYSSVSALYVGVSESSEVCSAEPYKIENPIVYYGSSITQGGCASRPGMAYQSIISRRISADFINLGFSGNAKAEDEIADYISRLNMSCFVYDYDHNAPSIEHLQNTHLKMFRKIRENNPDLPIVIMSRPKFTLSDDETKRYNIIKTTYDNAVADGDKNVYFIGGPELMALAENDGTVDNCHPNDFGFASMAKALGDLLVKIFE